jgi:tetratricopeptide (TPR) repeat protein
MLETSVELARSTGNYHRLAHGLLSLGDLAREEEDLDRAVSLYERSLKHYRQLNETLGMAESLSGLGDMARVEGGTERARELYAQALALYRKSGYAGGMAGTLVGFALKNGPGVRFVCAGGSTRCWSRAMYRYHHIRKPNSRPPRQRFDPLWAAATSSTDGPKAAR